MEKQQKIFVAGGTGLVGSAIIRKLLDQGYTNITATYNSRKPVNAAGKVDYKPANLLDAQQVENLYNALQPDWVFVAAAKVGGIVANNTYRADFIYENLQMQNNLIHGAWKAGVAKLLFLGSSCIYPKQAPQPMKEEHLLTDVLEYTNEPYAIAKIAGMKLCENYNLQYGTNFIAVMPTNLYGPNDNYHLENSHVLPALIRKNHLAKALDENNWDAIRRDFSRRPLNGISGDSDKRAVLAELSRQGIEPGNPVSLKLWGSGKPKREFLHADDLADACVFLMEQVDFKDILKQEYDLERVSLPLKHEIRNTHFNVGTGRDISIQELAEIIRKIVGFRGTIKWDTSLPDGTYRKLLDVSRLHAYGWKEKIDFKQSLKDIYDHYLM